MARLKLPLQLEARIIMLARDTDRGFEEVVEDLIRKGLEVCVDTKGIQPTPEVVRKRSPETNTLKEAAVRLGISLRTLYRALAAKEIRAVKFRGRLRISELEIQRILRDGIGIQPYW